MPYVQVGTENRADIEIHYNDHGSWKPIILIHGYPLDGNSEERQERFLLENGYRCISYDRRGCGQSSTRERTSAGCRLGPCELQSRRRCHRTDSQPKTR
jgi:pimeloyl-ACP methyl ester carboxylesterase